jgi:hypothetical protein
MFAPLVAKVQTKTASSRAGTPKDARSIMTRRPLGGRAGEAEANPANMSARRTTLCTGWDFGKIPLFPPQRADHGQTIHQAARQGLAGSAQTLPHRAQIERSFGRYDVGTIRAYVGGAAAETTRRLGAIAYAMGNSVAFRESPDLHTAAHEAAHVVQQRSGVQLKGMVGREGDAYEQHADTVADAVVAGRSAQQLLDKIVDSSGGRGIQDAPSPMFQLDDEERVPDDEAAAEPVQGRFVEPPADGLAVQRKAYKGRGGIGIMAPASMPYFFELGSSTTEDVEATVTWEPHGIPQINVESRDLKIGTNGPGDVVSLTPVYMESQFYGRPYPQKAK